MNAGLTNLDTLRKHLLAGSLKGDTQFDLQIKVIGLGVAGLFETFCNRRLAWLEDDEIQITGDRPHYYLPRFPIAEMTKVEMRYFQTDNWTEITGQPITINFETGLVHFGYTLGRNPLQVRLTWTGGYWFETLEPDDANYPSTQPALAADPNLPPSRIYLLPDSLTAAFLLQCEHTWDAKDNLGIGMTDKPGEQSAVGKLEMSPMVKQMLQPFVRYQLS